MNYSRFANFKTIPRKIGPGIQSLGLKRRCKYNIPRKRSWDFTTVTHAV